MSITADICAFLRRRAGGLYSGYTDEALLDYVLFHSRQGTLSFTRHFGEVSGVAVGWAQVGEDYQPFRWQPHDPNGDHWFWSILAADSPKAALALVCWFQQRHPESISLPTLAHRNGNLRRYAPGKTFELYRKALSWERI
jgi:hypothetical protein